MIDTVEKEFAALKPAGGGKREDSDFFVAATIDLVDHKATVDYPIVEGLRKASEQLADFMLDQPEGGLRRWKAVGRSKSLKAAEGLRKNARNQSIEGQLENFKLMRSGRKSLEDFFVVGTAELFKETQHADVRFQILNGTKATASFLLDFILSGDSQTQRQWHVFFRAKDRRGREQIHHPTAGMVRQPRVATRENCPDLSRQNDATLLREVILAVVSTAFGFPGVPVRAV